MTRCRVHFQGPLFCFLRCLSLLFDACTEIKDEVTCCHFYLFIWFFKLFFSEIFISEIGYVGAGLYFVCKYMIVE